MTDHQKIHRADPLVQKKKRSSPSSSCCCKFTITLLIVLLSLLIIVGATIAILYLTLRPKLPKYSIDSLRISELRLNLDTTLYAKFEVKITATNPNKKIAIYYQRGSRLSAWYSGTELCRGSLPIFYQGHRNTTSLHVGLTGQRQYGAILMKALLEQQRNNGRVPLDLKVEVPVRVEVGNWKLREVRILGTCLLVVDSLSANTLISIKARTCKFRIKL